MNRRNLLAVGSAGVALGLSGCLDTVQSVASADPGENGTESCGTGSATEAGREVCLVDVGTVPEGELEEASTDALPVEFDVELLSNRLTSDAIPEFEIRMQNQGEEPLAVAERTFWWPFIDSEGLRVIPEVRVESMQSEASDAANCVQTVGYGTDLALRPEEIAPGDTKRERLGVVGNEEELEGRCPDPGEYTIYGVTSGMTDDLEAHDDGPVAWGFTIELT